MHKDGLLTTAEVARRLDLSVWTVNRYVREGKLRVEMQAPGPKGARLFHPAEIDRLAAMSDPGDAEPIRTSNASPGSPS